MRFHVHEQVSFCWMAVVLLGAGMSGIGEADLAAQESPGQAEGAGQRSEKSPNAADVDAQIGRLIKQLGDDDYFVRERAQKELAKFSFEAFDALNAATAHEDLEISARAKYLLRLMRVEWTTKEDPPEVERLLSDYEAQNEKNKVARMVALAELPDGSGISALCRLVRYEKSPLLSRRAAIQLLGREPPDKKHVGAIRSHLKGSRRPAATWVLTYLRLGDDPDGVIKDWTGLVEAEQKMLKTGRTDTAIVAELVRLQIGWLKAAGQNDRAVAAMRKLIELEDGDLQKLALLLGWLHEEKAWSVVEELYAKFKPQFHENSFLLYGLAQARLELGEQEKAEATAKRAQKLNPGKDPEQLIVHLMTAYRLQNAGLFRWADAEFRHVIETDDAKGGMGIAARSWLAEMWHDRGQDRRAADMLKALVDPFGDEAPDDTDIGTPALEIERTLGDIRSRMYYFFACDAKEKNLPAKHREFLDKAVAVDPADLDVLIACHQLPEQTPEYRKKIRELIEKSADGLRKDIKETPQAASGYNQLAWLIGNTAGDLDEAMKCAETAVRLRPQNGGYLDTLAHVYFAKGDYENAVKTQVRAAEFERHSGLIAKKLAVFKKKLEEEKNRKK